MILILIKQLDRTECGVVSGTDKVNHCIPIRFGWIATVMFQYGLIIKYSLFMQMSKAETETEIDNVLNKPDMTIVNCSKWSPTQPIIPVTKASLLQELIYDEVVDKRHKQIDGLRKGLQQFDMISLLKRYPTKLGRAFVHQGCLLDAPKLLNLIDLNSKGFTEKQECIVKWFIEYIECRATENRGQ